MTERLRPPCVRKTAAHVFPAVPDQGSHPTGILPALLAEEAAGRDAVTVRSSRRPAGVSDRQASDTSDDARIVIPDSVCEDNTFTACPRRRACAVPRPRGLLGISAYCCRYPPSLVWVLVVENLLRGVVALLGWLEAVTDVLPRTAAGSLAGALSASLLLFAYSVVFIAAMAVVVRRRDT